jgi:hypothetical protein
MAKTGLNSYPMESFGMIGDGSSGFDIRALLYLRSYDIYITRSELTARKLCTSHFPHV